MKTVTLWAVVAGWMVLGLVSNTSPGVIHPTNAAHHQHVSCKYFSQSTIYFCLSPPSPFAESLNETLSLRFSSFSAAEHRARLELVSGVLAAVLCKLFV